MRRESQLRIFQSQLLHHLSQMPVIEHRVGGKIVCHRNEMSARRRRLARSRYSRLRVGNNSALAIDQSCLEQWRQSQNHRRRVATWIRHQLRRRDAVAIQLRQTIHRFRRQLRGGDRVRILKRINRAMLRLLQPPRTAQIDHAQSLRNRPPAQETATLHAA